MPAELSRRTGPFTALSSSLQRDLFIITFATSDAVPCRTSLDTLLVAFLHGEAEAER